MIIDIQKTIYQLINPQDENETNLRSAVLPKGRLELQLHAQLPPGRSQRERLLCTGSWELQRLP